MNVLKQLVRLFPSDTIYVDGKPYLTRSYLLLRDWNWFSINIHHFHSSDQGLELHNHPWRWAISLILAGGYFEERLNDPSGYIVRRMFCPGMINRITNRMFHRVDLIDEEKGAWSLFVAGPRIYEKINGERVAKWGFLDRNTREYKHFTMNPAAIP